MTATKHPKAAPPDAWPFRGNRSMAEVMASERRIGKLFKLKRHETPPETAA